jgi:hypothetical protein
MHPFSILTLGIFVAGYITARWDLVTRLYELAIFAWDHGVVVRFIAGFWRGHTSLSVTDWGSARGNVDLLLTLVGVAFGYRREHSKDSCFFQSSFSSWSCQSITWHRERGTW